MFIVSSVWVLLVVLFCSIWGVMIFVLSVMRAVRGVLLWVICVTLNKYYYIIIIIKTGGLVDMLLQ